MTSVPVMVVTTEMLRWPNMFIALTKDSRRRFYGWVKKLQAQRDDRNPLDNRNEVTEAAR